MRLFARFRYGDEALEKFEKQQKRKRPRQSYKPRQRRRKNNLISPVDAGLFYIVGYAIYLIHNYGGNHVKDSRNKQGRKN